MSRRVRHPIGPPVQAPLATTLRIRTRLRASAADQAVTVALGTHLGRLARADLAKRSRAGRKPKFGYRSERELATKQARPQQLRAGKARLDRDVKAGRVSPMGTQQER